MKETPITYVWGKMKRVIPNFGVLTIRGDMDANARDVVDLDVQASGYGTSIQMVGSAGTCIHNNRRYLVLSFFPFVLSSSSLQRATWLSTPTSLVCGSTGRRSVD